MPLTFLVTNRLQVKKDEARARAQAKAAAKALRINAARRKRGLDPLSEDNAPKRPRVGDLNRARVPQPADAESSEGEQSDDDEEPPAQLAAPERLAGPAQQVDLRAAADLTRLITGLKAEVATLQVEHRITSAKVDQLEKDNQTRQQHLQRLADSQAREIKALEAAIGAGSAASAGEDPSSSSEDSESDVSDDSDEDDED